MRVSVVQHGRVELRIEPQGLRSTALSGIVLRMLLAAPFALVSIPFEPGFELTLQFLDLLLSFALVAEPEFFYSLKASLDDMEAVQRNNCIREGLRGDKNVNF